MPNPYNYSTVVTDPEMFFGRESHLSALYVRLKNMQSTSVVGLRRIGKSSLLYQLARTLPGELGQNYVPIYIDLQDARYRAIASFVKTTAMALNEKMGGILSVTSVIDMSSFSEMIEKLRHTNIRPVLCLDEFEEFMQHPEEFNDEFLEALRALGGRGKLAMVTTSQTSLAELIRAKLLTSPFDNIFAAMELGLLEPDAALALRREPFEQEGTKLSAKDEVLVEELAGRHPFFLQMACYHLYEARSQPAYRREDVVREPFGRDAESHFERLWEHLGASEKAALKAIVGQAVFTNESERVLGRLVRLGLVEQRDGRWRPFSQAFAERIQQYPTLLESQRPSKTDGRAQHSVVRLILFTGVAVAVMLIAALISRAVSVQQFLIMFIIATVILIFALVGIGALTGQEFLDWLRDILGWLRDL